MKEFDIVVHYPENEAVIKEIRQETTKAFLYALEKLLTNTGFTVAEKKQLIDGLMDTFMPSGDYLRQNGGSL